MSNQFTNPFLTVAITFLQHTDASMPHYDNNTWNFARGATATIDRDLGFIDTHLFHDIIGTHVCHHLVSTIPFYHAGEASQHIKKVMGQHYKADVKTPFWTAFWKNQRSCKFVEESEGMEGSGVYMYRNLYKREGEVHAKDFTDGKADAVKENESKTVSKVVPVGAMASAVSTSRNAKASRRFSQSVSERAKAGLPLLSEVMGE